MLNVVQCWDDGVSTDIRLIELLHKYGAKATFNLCPGHCPLHTVMPRWMKYGEHGCSDRGFLSGRIGTQDLVAVYGDFQVASHCWKHENVNNMPPDQWIKCAVDARKYLEDLFQRSCPGFAWPYGQVTEVAKTLLREAGFVYGRTTQNLADITQCKDAMTLATNCHFQDPAFYEKYEAAKETGVFYFWGHSYETMDYDKLWEQLEYKLRFICEDSNSRWANVAEVVTLSINGKPK